MFNNLGGHKKHGTKLEKLSSIHEIVFNNINEQKLNRKQEQLLKLKKCLTKN